MNEVEIWGREDGCEDGAGRADREILEPSAIGELIEQLSWIQSCSNASEQGKANDAD